MAGPLGQDISAVHPDDFLLDQLDLYPGRTIECLRTQIEAYQRPQMTIVEFLAVLGKTAPRFSSALVERMG
ncbi:hypothetical protein BJP25_31360 [Actinokineospora bangkokensis]|uniref:VapC50 C-terminal domain-containing protein n=1 Tax=Actinokineospora bangkokensis TaxID=1193682 RepID=A0A1Q9LG98_9PSEU|nr:hypothetical protein BJP25_31360 [Actinokineospora bangkokensis]